MKRYFPKLLFRSQNTRSGISASCLDLHFTNKPELVRTTNVDNITNSDHCYIEVKRCGKKEYLSPQFTRKRDWSKINWGLANEQMKLLDLSAIYRTRDVNVAVIHTTMATQAVLDSHAKVRNFNNRKNHLPYMDMELLQEERREEERKLQTLVEE